MVPRCEVRWRHLKRPADLEQVVGSYLSKLAQGAKKGKHEFSSEQNIRLPKLGKRFEGRDFRTFSWGGGSSGYGVAWYCHHCGRCVILQIYGPEDEAGLDLLRSARDHGQQDGQAWSVYDFSFSVPADYRLKRHELKAGCLELEFAHEQELLLFTRFSLAARTIAVGGLAAFAGGCLKQKLADYAGELERGGDSEHDYLRRQAAFRKRRRGVRLLFPVDRKWSAAELLWHCRPQDKIILVAWQGRTAKAPDLDELARKVRCH